MDMKDLNLGGLVKSLRPILAEFGMGIDGNEGAFVNKLKEIASKNHESSGGLTGEASGLNFLRSLLGDKYFGKLVKHPNATTVLAELTNAGAGIFDTSSNAKKIAEDMVVSNLMPITDAMSDIDRERASKYNDALYATNSFILNTVNGDYENGLQNVKTGGLSFEDFAASTSAAYAKGLLKPGMSAKQIEDRAIGLASSFNVMKRISDIKNPNEFLTLFSSTGLPIETAYKNSLDLYRTGQSLGIPDGSLSDLLSKSIRASKAKGRIGIDPFLEARADMLDVYKAKEISSDSSGKFDSNIVYKELRDRRKNDMGARNILKGAYLALTAQGKSDQEISRFLDTAAKRTGGNEKSLLSFMATAGLSVPVLKTELHRAQSEGSNERSSKVAKFFSKTDVLESLSSPNKLNNGPIRYSTASDGEKMTDTWKLKNLAHQWGYETKDVNSYDDMLRLVGENEQGGAFNDKMSYLSKLDKKHNLSINDGIRTSGAGEKARLLSVSRELKRKEDNTYSISTGGAGSGLAGVMRKFRGGAIGEDGFVDGLKDTGNAFIGTPDSNKPGSSPKVGSFLDSSRREHAEAVSTPSGADLARDIENSIDYDRNWKNRD